MKIEGPLVEGRFIKRINRFEAAVEAEGAERLVHVPNTGRLRELLLEGAVVLLRKFENKKRKTGYGLLLVRKNGVWVSIDSANVPNRIVFEGLEQGLFKQFDGYTTLRREISVDGNRFDFGLFGEGLEYFIEVKGVTLVEDGIAYFPDAPTERGTRHLKELTRLRQEGKGAGVIFVIQREDAKCIRPNDRTDQAFGLALRQAAEAGVEMWAYTLSVSEKEIVIEREVPVVLG